ncbi:MAG TPA: FG-GAP-like repeat-containing protein [Planctomycetota bacterium]|jgi:hypothetical protein|nr:FG-GAP-like repeat-containing protein [Planctomycetota bacterium]
MSARFRSPCTSGIVLSFALLAFSLLVPGASLRAQSQLFLFTGSGPNAQCGRSVAAVGDVNGDGATDLLVGMPGASPFGLTLAGQAVLFSGATGLPIFTLIGVANLDQFGYAVAGAGDVNGDGVPDLIVGAPEATQGPAYYVGYVKVVSGTNGAALFTIAGTAPSQEFGRGVAGVGDSNSDGNADFVIGAPGTNVAGSPFAGQATVYSGATGGVLFALNGTPTLPALSFYEFGASTAGPGDLNGDGVPDILVGSPAGFSNTGRANAFSGASGGMLLTLFGSPISYDFGTSVAGSGDLNSDGIPDFIVGAPGQPGVYAFSGSTGSLLLTLTGLVAPEGFGSAVAGGGDVNGDGSPDLVVGAPLADPFGIVDAGQTLVFSGPTGANLYSFIGTSPPAPAAAGDQFGTSVAIIGDLNGDGRADLLVGAPRAAAGGLSDVGFAKVASFDNAAGVTLFGTGCAGSGGFVPAIGTVGGVPNVGNAAFGATVSNAVGASVAILVVGTSSTTWAGGPLPLSLSFAGLGGCLLLVSPDALLAVGTTGAGAGAGVGTIPLPIPSTAALVGQLAYLQWYVVDPGPSILPGALSQGLQVFIL